MNSTQPRSSTKVRALLVFGVLCLIWSSTWGFIKVGLRDLPPVTFLTARFVLAAILMVIIARLRRAVWPRTYAEWRLLAITGVLTFTINYGLVYWGENYTSSGLAALFQATIPLFGLLLAQVYLPNERLTARRLLGVLVGLAGVGIIFARQISIGDRWALAGGVGIVAGAFAAAYSGVLVKARAAKFDLTVLLGGQLCFGLIPLLIVALLKEGDPTKMHWTGMAVAAILYLALVGSVTAFLLYYWLVRNMDVTKSQLISLIIPVLAVVLGMIFLGERVTWHLAAGALCIFIGIALVIWRRRAPGKTVAERIGRES
jgi:drug/metabolite transporter (DMT)-like permease